MATLNNSSERGPTLLEWIGQMPPELRKMMWCTLLQQPEQPVRMKGTCEHGHDLGNFHPSAWDVLPGPWDELYGRTVLEDLIAPIVGGLLSHGASQETLDKARHDFFIHNTFFASTRMVDTFWDRHTFSGSFAEQYAPYVRYLELQDLAYILLATMA